MLCAQVTWATLPKSALQIPHFPAVTAEKVGTGQDSAERSGRSSREDVGMRGKEEDVLVLGRLVLQSAPS